MVFIGRLSNFTLDEITATCCMALIVTLSSAVAPRSESLDRDHPPCGVRPSRSHHVHTVVAFLFGFGIVIRVRLGICMCYGMKRSGMIGAADANGSGYDAKVRTSELELWLWKQYWTRHWGIV